MKTRVLILVTALSLLGFLSCSKQEEPVPERQQEEVKALSVPEAVEVLTKSLTKEDLEGLSLFLKQGEAERSLYLEIAMDGEPLVSGEVSLVTEKGFRYVGLDLLVLGQIPVTGNIDTWNLALYMAEAELVKGNPEYLASALEKVNAAINVNVLFAYRLEFHPVQDEQTGEIAIEPFLVDISDPESRVSVAELLALLGAIGL